MWRIGRAPNSIPIYSYIQQDATLHNLFISGNCSTCFGWYFRPSSGAHTTLSTASGICHAVTAIWHYRGRVGTGLSVLWVAYGFLLISFLAKFTNQLEICSLQKYSNVGMFYSLQRYCIWKLEYKGTEAVSHSVKPFYLCKLIYLEMNPALLGLLQ
jgi:hypothetical protein